jgi:hypothetical protein
MQQLTAADSTLLGESEQTRGDRRRGVDHGRQMGVVIFEDIGADRI